MFDRYQGGDKAVLVHVDFSQAFDREDIHEFVELVESAGVSICEVLRASRVRPDPKGFIGAGKLAELQDAIVNSQADVVIFNHALSPAQERNIEQHLKCRVIDRTRLILDIFAQRAHSFEGKLQVELAQLRHVSTRLVRGWTHLERQKGGIGLRGPGETQLETDRRLIRGRIAHILKKLEKVGKQREQGRRARKRSSTFTVSLVGYTNAGKSSLFNTMTTGQVYAADQLFATLDPTLRKVSTRHGEQFVLADTVGFIRHLPHELIAAFRSTLQETKEADLLIHVIDAANEEKDEQIEEVYTVLEAIGADKVPVIEVYNKIDLLNGVSVHTDYDDERRPIRHWVSAKEQMGIESLADIVGQYLFTDICEYSLKVPPAHARVRSALYERQCIINETVDESGNFLLKIALKESDWRRMSGKLGVDLNVFTIN